MVGEPLVPLGDAQTRRHLFRRLNETWNQDPSTKVRLVFVQLTEAKRLADMVGHCTWQVIPRVMFERLQRGSAAPDLFWLEVWTWAVWTESAAGFDRFSVGPAFLSELAVALHDHDLGREAAETEGERREGISRWEQVLAECKTGVSVFPASLRLRGATSEPLIERLKHLEGMFKSQCQAFDPLPWPAEMLV